MINEYKVVVEVVVMNCLAPQSMSVYSFRKLPTNMDVFMVTKDKKVIKCSTGLDIKDYGYIIAEVVFSPKSQEYIIRNSDDLKTAYNYYGNIANEWYHNTEQFYDKLAEIPWNYAFVIYEDDKINKGLKMFNECELEVTPDTFIYGLFLGAVYEILVGEDKLGGVR